MDPSQLEGKRLGIVLTDEKDGCSFAGAARWDGETLKIDRGPDQEPFEVPKEWHEHIKRVTSPVVKAVLDGAEFWLKIGTGRAAEDDID